MERQQVAPQVQLPTLIAPGAVTYGVLVAATMMARVRGIVSLVRQR